jgi:hypothetical protein
MDLEYAEATSERSGEVVATNEAINRRSKGMQGVTTCSQSGGVAQHNKEGGDSGGRTTIGGFLVGSLLFYSFIEINLSQSYCSFLAQSRTSGVEPTQETKCGFDE